MNPVSHVSVIIPVYNAGKHIGRAINSVRTQPEVNEIIIVDDGSSDNSAEVCRNLQAGDPRISILHHPGHSNKGVSASRNLGITHAKNPVIAFLDADDYYLPGRFTTAMQCFVAEESIDGVYEMIGLHSETAEIKPYAYIEEVSSERLFENLQPIGEKVWFSCDGLTVKKALFEKAGLFDETLKTSEDTLQWFKLAACGKLVAGKIHEPVSITESRSDSLTTDRALVQRDFILMLLKLFNACRKFRCSAARKELVLQKFFFFYTRDPYRLLFSSFKRTGIILGLISADPRYILFHSAAFRKFVGDISGFKRSSR